MIRLVLASVVSYLVGTAAGHALAAESTRRMVDLEWARMLENGMVGPGLPTHPTRGI